MNNAVIALLLLAVRQKDVRFDCSGDQILAIQACWHHLINMKGMNSRQRSLHSYRIVFRTRKSEYQVDFLPLRPNALVFGWNNPNGVYLEFHLSKKTLQITSTVLNQ
jgi:hypothetical protein